MTALPETHTHTPTWLRVVVATWIINISVQIYLRAEEKFITDIASTAPHARPRLTFKTFKRATFMFIAFGFIFIHFLYC